MNTSGIQPIKKTAILLNRKANHGRAGGKWSAIESRVRSTFLQNAIEPDIFEADDVSNSVSSLIEVGYQMFIAAGGDGSMHYLLQEIMKSSKSSELILGAVGLGSSNDFHKPFRETINGVPLRINPERAKMHDVGCVRYTDQAGCAQTRYFLINASIGVTANANWLFNHPDSLLQRLKGRFVSLAIIYAAIKTIMKHQGYKFRIKTETFCTNGQISNIAVLKSPHVSGSFTYDQQLRFDDGLLGLNICEGSGRRRLLGVLFDLSRGVFSGKPGRISTYIRQVYIDTMGDWVPLEMDGEVVQASDIYFSILPKALAVVQN